MTGRQFLDAIYILKASRSVLAKHIGLRRRHLDIYSKTSSLAKAVKTQASRFPLTARAVSNLADQLKNSQGSDLPSHDLQMASSEYLEGKDTSTTTISGRESVHFDTNSGPNPRTDPVLGEEPGTRLENAKRSPLPDGSALSANDENPSPSRGRDTFSDRSLIESQHNILADIDRKSDEILQPSSTNRTSIPRPSTYGSCKEPDSARKLQRLAEKKTPSVSAEALPPSEPWTTTSNPKLGELDTNKQHDILFTRPAHTSPVLSSLPRVKLPMITTSTQDGIENLSDKNINQDVFYSARPSGKSVPDAQALPEQGHPSDAMYSEMFHSPRVARLIKSENTKGGLQDDLGLSGTQDLRLKKRKLPRETDEESLKSVSIAPPINPETVDLLEEKKPETDRQLAESLINNSTSSSSTASEVSFKLRFTRNHILMD